MTPLQFRTVITRIGLSQVQAAHTLHVTPRTARRWALGAVELAPTAAKLLRLIQAGKVSIEDVRAAAPCFDRGRKSGSAVGQRSAPRLQLGHRPLRLSGPSGPPPYPRG